MADEVAQGVAGAMSEVFRYENGVLYWRERPSTSKVNKRFNTMRSGKPAGWIYERIDGYKRRCVRIGKRKYSTAQCVWIIHNGSIPTGMQIDHINRDSLDDRIENLRLATGAENIRNVVHKKGVNGYRGVLRKSKNSYAAVLFINGTRVREYSFTTAESAARRYDELARQHHGPFAVTNFNTANNGR